MNDDQLERAIAQAAGFNVSTNIIWGVLLAAAFAIFIIAVIAGAGAAVTISWFDITDQVAKGLVIAGWLGTACYITTWFETVDAKARGLAQVAYALLVHSRRGNNP